MATTTNYSWTTPDDTDLVKDGAAAIRTLGSAIDTTVFNNAGAAIAKSLIDAEGDLIVGDAADAVQRLAIGSDGNVLTVDTTVDGKIKWAAATSNSGLVFINSSSFTAAATVNLDNVFSSTYNNYKIVLSATASTSPVSIAMRMRASGSTNSSADYNQLQVIQASGNYYAAAATTGNTSWTEVALCQTTSPRTSVFFEIYNPFATTNTAATSIFAKGFTGSPEFQLYAWGMSVTTSYDGFALVASSGNITGTVAVYGMRNS